MIPEEYLNRIKTLVKVTKLLGDKYREQENKINRIQDDITQLRIELLELKETLLLKPRKIDSTYSTQLEVDKAATPDFLQQKSDKEEVADLELVPEVQIKQTAKSTEKDSEKKDLIDALRIIENL